MLLYSAQTGCRAHPDSYPIGTPGPSAGRLNYSSVNLTIYLHCAEVKNIGGILPLPPYLHDVVID
jgi:hypothetical protein